MGRLRCVRGQVAVPASGHSYAATVSRDGGAIVWRCSVAIPTFKEAASLAPVVATVEPLPGPVEVIVVDDGSTDGTAVEIAWVQQDLPIASLRLAYSLGKGAAVRTGIGKASAPVAVLHDADLEYAPASLTALVETIESGIADAVHSPVVAGAALAPGTVRR